GLEPVDGGAPELRAFEDVGLVDLRELLAALAGEIEGNPSYADDLVLCVAHGVDGLATARCCRALIPRPWLAEVQAAEKLADEEDVDAPGDLGAQRRVVRERGEGEAGTEVREAAEDLADLQKTGLGALVGCEVVELVVADGAEENSVGIERDLDGLFG